MAMKRGLLLDRCCCEKRGDDGTKAVEGFTNKRAVTVAIENFIVKVECVEIEIEIDR
jgi:hypothetical protein